MAREDPDRAAAERAAERRLIEAAQQGDHRAFADLMRRHQRRVFSLITHTLRQPNDVEDIAQQVFLKAYLALKRFDFRAGFSTWLYRIAVNECYDQLRRRRALKSGAGNEVPMGEPHELERAAHANSPAQPDVARRLEARQLVERLFARLAPEDRMLMTLKELEGLSIAEIAAAMGLKENTIKVRLFRIRRRLLEAYRRLSRTRG